MEFTMKNPPRAAAVRRLALTFYAVALMLPATAFAQAPWERAASSLEYSVVGLIGPALGMCAIVITGLRMMSGDRQASVGDIAMLVIGACLVFAAPAFIPMFR
jgi:type IV secretory pathway VirB2 component (pilin)